MLPSSTCILLIPGRQFVNKNDRAASIHRNVKRSYSYISVARSTLTLQIKYNGMVEMSAGPDSSIERKKI